MGWSCVFWCSFILLSEDVKLDCLTIHQPFIVFHTTENSHFYIFLLMKCCKYQILLIIFSLLPFKIFYKFSFAIGAMFLLDFSFIPLNNSKKLSGKIFWKVKTILGRCTTVLTLKMKSKGMNNYGPGEAVLLSWLGCASWVTK